MTVQRYVHQEGRYALLLKGGIQLQFRVSPYDKDKTAQEQWDEGFDLNDLKELTKELERAEDIMGVRAGTWGIA